MTTDTLLTTLDRVRRTPLDKVTAYDTDEVVARMVRAAREVETVDVARFGSSV